MSERSRAQRFEIIVSPHVIYGHMISKAAWYETQEEIEAGLKWGEEKAELLKWVRRAMGRKLTKRERRCIELYFFNDMSLREVAGRTNTNASSVQRAIKRAVRKLRNASATRKPKRKVPRDPAQG